MSALLDEDQKLRRAFAAGAELASVGEDCPAADRLWAVATLEAPSEERLRVAEHTARCAACAEDFRIVSELVRESATSAAQPAPGVVVVGPWAAAGPARRRLWGSLAAVLVLGLAMAALWQSYGPDPGPVYRGGDEAAITSLLGESPKLSRDAWLRWQGPPGALYNVKITAPDLRRVVEALDLDKNELQLRPADFEAYPAGTTFSWQVTALLEDGQRLESSVFRFELKE